MESTVRSSAATFADSFPETTNAWARKSINAVQAIAIPCSDLTLIVELAPVPVVVVTGLASEFVIEQDLSISVSNREVNVR